VSLTIHRSLVRRTDAELVALHDHWSGGLPPDGRGAIREVLKKAMADPAHAGRVRSDLPGNAGRLLDALLQVEESEFDFQTAQQIVRGTGIKSGGLRSAIAELHELGLIGADSSDEDSTVWAIPRELKKALSHEVSSGLEGPELLTLHGFLEGHFRRTEGAEEAAHHARRMYRFLASESALCERFEELDLKHDGLLGKIVSEYGGLLPKALFEELDISETRAATLQKELEEASLGTIAPLELERFGIRQRGLVLAIFNEAVIAWLRNKAAASPSEPFALASIGVDFVSNFSRFASFVGDETIRFTVRGSIYKSTGKRIAEKLIPNPGREFRRLEILEHEHRFAQTYQFVDRTGERSFRLTESGRSFLDQPLHEKQRMMLDWLIEDRELPGDMAHQLRLRRTALRFIKRMDQGIWYDAMMLPFVARNHYLAELAAEQARTETDSFPVHSSADLQSLAWNLFSWIRRNLYLLGVIEMGYDANGRATSIRLTQMGMELLELIPGTELEGAGHLVVNPDFEVVLFPESRSHELIYRLDAFCERELSDSLYHYRITPGSLHRGLSQGQNLDDMLQLLSERSRTPLPQNVEFSLESWAKSDGMVTWDGTGMLTCDAPEILDRLQLHPELERIGWERLNHATLKILDTVSEDQLSLWVRDFGVSFRIAS